MITKDDTFESGDTFSYVYENNSTVTYILQKLPDFELWILISEKLSNGEHAYWMKPMPTAFEAFGNCECKFTRDK